MATSIRRAGAHILRSLARALDPAAANDEIQLYAKSVGGTPQLFVRSPDFARQVSGIECSIWDKPLVPHPLDDEFESTTLDPAWTISGPAVQGGIDPFTNPASDQPYELHTQRRPSWLMVQPTASIIFSKNISSISNGNYFVYARFSLGMRYTSPANNEATVQLDIGAPTYDLNNRISLYFNESDAGTYQAEFLMVTAGATVAAGRTRSTVNVNSGMPAIEAVGIQKRSNTYDAWAFTGAGTALWLGQISTSMTANTVHLRFGNVSNGAPAYLIHGCDFVRFKEGVVLP